MFYWGSCIYKPEITHLQIRGFYDRKSSVVFVKSGPLIVWFGSGRSEFVMHYGQYAKLSFPCSDEIWTNCGLFSGPVGSGRVCMCTHVFLRVTMHMCVNQS